MASIFLILLFLRRYCFSKEFRGLRFLSQPAVSWKASKFRGTPFRGGPVSALFGDNGVQARNDGILSYSKDTINGQDNVSKGGAINGTVTTGGFFEYQDEQDLDCPTKGFSPVAEAIEDIHQGKVGWFLVHWCMLYLFILQC